MLHGVRKRPRNLSRMRALEPLEKKARQPYGRFAKRSTCAGLGSISRRASARTSSPARMAAAIACLSAASKFGGRGAS